ncbi:hypothetical protein NQ314_002082 [Rhamnusium bicolor]|uniref:HAT C-terminal dimerisation domain-containing protein n=1 Tax=Rhamnusium bicolor TaxID=1586634 RepID=A0AAV8ZQK6_9CUCU|nr:hypothetical protein NQ314_002082 [Rhamnusium bicolor]
MKCICHSFHLCASYACEKLPQEVEQFCREVYNYFSNSPKRAGELKEFQYFANTSPVKILHPSQTRWLSLEFVLKRLLSQYNTLLLYFTDQSYQNIPAANMILNHLNQLETKLYLEFLEFILPTFNVLNAIMQSETPKIQIIYREVTAAVKTILDCYIKEDIMKKNKTNVYDIDFKNPRNFLPIDKMYFEAKTQNSSLDNYVLNGVKIKCLDFYIESIRQIFDRFPLKNSAFEKLKFIDPKHVISRKTQSISEISIHFPNLIDDIQVIDNEWRMLRNIDFNEVGINTDEVEKNDDVNVFWRSISKIKLGSGQAKFGNLTSLIFNLLCLPHSSTNVERVFSQINLNKTQIKNRLKSDT